MLVDENGYEVVAGWWAWDWTWRSVATVIYQSCVYFWHWLRYGCARRVCSITSRSHRIYFVPAQVAGAGLLGLSLRQRIWMWWGGEFGPDYLPQEPAS